MKLSATILIIGLLFGCVSKTKAPVNEPKQISWAVQFADAAMTRFDSLIYYNNNKPKFEYDYAFLGFAIAQLDSIDPKYGKYNRDYIDYFVGTDGTIKGYSVSTYNIDRVRPGNNLLELYAKTGEAKYKTAIDSLVKQMEMHPRTNSNGYWHKKVYPYQMWLDGIYMASPFLARYAADFNQPQWFDEVTFQIKHIYEKTLDKNTGLLYHAWDESREQRWCNPETGQSKHFWSRAMGWYVMAIVDVLDYLPANHPDRAALVEILKNVSDALIKVQDKESGIWYQVLDMGGSEGNYLEASGSAMFIYAMAKGANKGYLDKSYFEIAGKSFDGMIKTLVTTGADGMPVLTNVCGGCGLGGNPYREADYNYYINEKRVDNDQKGVAPLILAAIELKK